MWFEYPLQWSEIRTTYLQAVRHGVPCNTRRTPADRHIWRAYGHRDRQFGEAGDLAGAGEGNRTLVVSLEGFCSTIELHPRGLTPDL